MYLAPAHQWLIVERSFSPTLFKACHRSSWGEARLTKVASLFREYGSPEDLRQILDEFVNERWARKEEREGETFCIFQSFQGFSGVSNGNTNRTPTETDPKLKLPPWFPGARRASVELARLTLSFFDSRSLSKACSCLITWPVAGTLAQFLLL